jgi:hypothetical protein
VVCGTLVSAIQSLSANINRPHPGWATAKITLASGLYLTFLDHFTEKLSEEREGEAAFVAGAIAGGLVGSLQSFPLAIKGCVDSSFACIKILA